MTPSLWGGLVLHQHGTSRPPVPPSSDGVVVTATLTGTMTSSLYESEIVAGGQTLIVTLTNSTWVASGTAFDAQRQNILNGIVSAQGEANGWNAVRSGLAVTDVVRTSATVVTITLDALATYSVTANETLTMTVPAGAIAANVATVATPTVTITEGAAVAWLGNLPSGYTLVDEFPFTAAIPGTPNTDRLIPSTNWGMIADHNLSGVSNIALVSDPTAPHSPNGVWQWTELAGQWDGGTYGGPATDNSATGVGGGTGWGNLYYNPSFSCTKLYACWYSKLSPGFWVHDISHKYINMWTDASGGGNLLVQLGHNGRYFEFFDVYGPNSFPPQISVPPPSDQWFLQEFQVELGNPGIIRIWIDGVLKTEYTNLQIGSTPGSEHINGFGVFHFMGGGGYHQIADQTHTHDHVVFYTA
jgi:hypothetical protein